MKRFGDLKGEGMNVFIDTLPRLHYGLDVIFEQDRIGYETD